MIRLFVMDLLPPHQLLCISDIVDIDDVIVVWRAQPLRRIRDCVSRNGAPQPNRLVKSTSGIAIVVTRETMVLLLPSRHLDSEISQRAVLGTPVGVLRP